MVGVEQYFVAPYTREIYWLMKAGGYRRRAGAVLPASIWMVRVSQKTLARYKAFKPDRVEL